MASDDSIRIYLHRKVPFLASLILIVSGVFFCVLYTLVWPPRFNFGDLLFLIAGPGQLGLGIWSVLHRPAPQLRIAITADAITVRPDGRGQGPVTIPWDDLTSVAQTGLSDRDTRLRFAATTGDHVVHTPFLDRTPGDILRLITIQLENKGKHLAQSKSPVLGADTGIWEVRAGIPFQTD
ncbi:hypothetical protein [Yoonia sp. R2-816]|uniref:hypothetical protein n=1 Tax=Yoonia sp. R2-816 TaxID=3342638 RepID=UPI00372D36F3